MNAEHCGYDKSETHFPCSDPLRQKLGNFQKYIPTRRNAIVRVNLSAKGMRLDPASRNLREKASPRAGISPSQWLLQQTPISSQGPMSFPCVFVLLDFPD